MRHPFFCPSRALRLVIVFLCFVGAALGQGNLSGSGVDEVSESLEERIERMRREGKDRQGSYAEWVREREQRSQETLEERIARLRKELLEAEMEQLAQAEASSEAAEVEEQLGSLSNALVIVSSDDAEGSGFIGSIRGRTFFITNVHVLGGARDARIRTIEGGETIELGDHAFLSKQRDVAIVPIEWSGAAFEVSASLLLDEVKIGDKITVMGNSDGARVATNLKGEVQGIGPDQLQVSAEFVPGNSGSPVLHTKHGKVIGVASYLKNFGSEWKDRRSREPEIRRFAYRLDGDIEWERYSLSEIYEQGAIYRNFEDRTIAMLH